MSSSDEEESSSVLMCDPEDVVIFAEPLGATSSSAVADALQLADLARSQAASSPLSGDEQYKRSVTLLKGGEEVLRQLDDERKSTRSAFNSLRLSRAHSAAAAAVSAPSQGHVATVTVGATDDDAANSKPKKAKKPKKTNARAVDGGAAAAATSNNSHTWNAQIDIEALATAVEHGAQVSAFLLSSLTKRDRELLEQKLLAKQQERLRARRILEEQLALVAAADQRTLQYMTLIRGQPEPADDVPDASNDTVVFQPAPDIDASEIAALSDDDDDDNSEDEDAAKSSRPSVVRKTAALAAGSSGSRVTKDVAQSPPRPIVVDETATPTTTTTTTTTTTQSERVAADVSVASPRICASTAAAAGQRACAAVACAIACVEARRVAREPPQRVVPRGHGAGDEPGAPKRAQGRNAGQVHLVPRAQAESQTGVQGRGAVAVRAVPR
jgi:hypothetical protein